MGTMETSEVLGRTSGGVSSSELSGRSTVPGWPWGRQCDHVSLVSDCVSVVTSTRCTSWMKIKAGERVVGESVPRVMMTTVSHRNFVCHREM